MEIIFVILLAIAIVLITYIALKLKGNQTSSEGIQGVPEWASQQLNENKTAIQSLTKELQETKTALTQCQENAATQKATLESERIASKNKLEDVLKLHEQQK